MNRRGFLRRSVMGSAMVIPGVVAGSSLAQSSLARSSSGPNERIAVAVAGVRGRGLALLQTFADRPDVDVTYVCDVDQSVLTQRAAQLEDRTGRRARTIKDFRTALDDKSVDALVLGTPDHWHAIPTIMACQAGKDVYVEKPDGHNAIEGRVMAAAASKYDRVVQLGTGARSAPHLLTAMEYLAKGHLGKVRFAKAWESARQGSIGHPPDSAPPPGVDYDMWLGPAPKRPFNVRRFHGSWRWFFDYGTGDLGNDGVHRLDMALWAAQTAIKAKGQEPPTTPRAVSAHGGKHYFDDDQQWPDNMLVTYEFPGCLLTYELRIWTPYPMHGEREGAAVYGDNASMVIGGRRWRVFDAKGKQVKEESGYKNDPGHVGNFIECMRSRARPSADLETIGRSSSLLCHLGNAAWRAGRTLRFDPETYTFIGDDEANQYLVRPKYRKPWLLPVVDEV